MANIDLTLINKLKDSKSEEDRKQCIPLLQAHLSGHPNDATAWYDLARCFDFIGLEKEAEPCYRKTFELGFQNLPLKEQKSFFVGYGSTLRNNFKFSESQEVLKEAVKNFPDYPALKVFLAFTQYSQEQYRLASQNLFKAIGGTKEKIFDGYERAIQWYAENLETHPAFPLPVVLETENLILRPLVETDIPAIFDYCSDPEVAKYVLWEPHETLEDSKELIEYAKRNYQKGLPEPYGVTLKKNPDVVIGTVGWFWRSVKNKDIELAYALSRKHWGQGIVVEALKEIINQALKDHDIHRITCRALAGNTSSCRVMEKLGMKHEGVLRQAQLVKGRYVDMIHYSILKSEWNTAV